MTASFRLDTRPTLAAIAFLALGATSVVTHAAPACSVKSAAAVTPVVELYTSEGCNSCPPADQWLSRLKSDPNVVALAFHVDYWDRLGWKDRFSSARYTQRQSQQQQTSGAGFSYTPQVIVDGVDKKDWFRLAAPMPSHGNAPVSIELDHEGTRFNATVSSLATSPRRLSAYWAVTEQGHVSAVKAGENEGATLRHDFVVREYGQVPGWTSQPGSPASFHYEVETPADPMHPRQVDLVVIDTETGRPVQAVKLGC